MEVIIIAKSVNKPVKFYPDKEKEVYKYAQSFNFTAKVKEWLLADMQGRLYIQSSNNPIPVYVVNVPSAVVTPTRQLSDLEQPSEFPELQAEEFQEYDATQFI